MALFDFSWFADFLKYIFPNLFFETFSETLIGDDLKDWKGRCLVQRIEPVRLSRSGKGVRLTLSASSVSDAYIDHIYISQPQPGGQDYDSAIDLTAAFAPLPPRVLFIPKGQSLTFPLPSVLSRAITYNLDKGQPLLTAIDFSAAQSSGIKCKQAVPTEQACAYSYYELIVEAGLNNRTPGYEKYPGIYLIEKIEVSASPVPVLSTKHPVP
jgi:hypothetical protein